MCLQCIQHRSSQALCFFTFKHIDTFVNILCSNVGLSRGRWDLNREKRNAKSSYPLNQNVTFVGFDCEMLIRTQHFQPVLNRKGIAGSLWSVRTNCNNQIDLGSGQKRPQLLLSLCAWLALSEMTGEVSVFYYGDRALRAE